MFSDFESQADGVATSVKGGSEIAFFFELPGTVISMFKKGEMIN
jgi:hypothetical protein